MRDMDLEVIVRHDPKTGGYWAEVVQLPGCFAAGHSRQELRESLEEAILLYLQGEDESTIVSSDHVEAVERYRLSEDRRLLPA